MNAWVLLIAFVLLIILTVWGFVCDIRDEWRRWK